MGDFSIYIIKTAILLSLLFSVYKLTAGRLKCASLQRALLLAIYPISLLSPFLKLEWFKTPIDKPVQNFDWSTLATLSNNLDTPSPQPNPIVDAVVMLMIGGSLLGVIIFIIGIIRIARCNFSGESCMIGNTRVTVVTSPEISPFSFGGRIFLSEAKNEMIIAHESSHIRHHHYLDLLLGRSISIIQWWNPLAWLMLREIHDVHEFQADNDVISQGHDMRDYQYLLLREAVGPRFRYMTDSFNHSSLKGLTMINRKDSKLSTRLLSLLCIPVATAGILAISSDTFANFIRPLSNAFQSDGIQNEKPLNITELPQLKQDTDFPESATDEEEEVSKTTLANEATVVKPERETKVETIARTDLPSIPEEETEQFQPIETVSMDNKINYKLGEQNINVVASGSIKKGAEANISSESIKEKPLSIRGISHDDSSRSPDVMVDGKQISFSSMKTMDPSSIKSISVYKNSDEHPHGLIVINLKETDQATENTK